MVVYELVLMLLLLLLSLMELIVGKILIRKMLLVMLMIVVVLDHSWRRRRGRGRAFQVDCCRDVVIRRGHCKFRLEKEKERDRNCTKAPPSFLCQYEPAAALDNQIKSPYRKMLISMYCLSSSSSPAVVLPVSESAQIVLCFFAAESFQAAVTFPGLVISPSLLRRLSSAILYVDEYSILTVWTRSVPDKSSNRE